MGNAIRPSTLDLHCLLYALVASHCWEQQHAYPNLPLALPVRKEEENGKQYFYCFGAALTVSQTLPFVLPMKLER